LLCSGGQQRTVQCACAAVGIKPGDRLSAVDTMRLVHDGAGYSRTEKVRQIAIHKTATQVVKVCWEGHETFRNCGECDKCIRTQLNFRAVGVEHAPCFDRPLDWRLIETVNLRNDSQANELKSIYAYATKAGINAGWVETLRWRIERYDNPPSKMRQLFTLIMPGEFSKIASKVRKRLVRA
jgi:hypothetical protein